MKFGLSWLRLVSLAACLWGFPAQVRAEIFQSTVEKPVEKLDTFDRPQKLKNGVRPWPKQSMEGLQSDSDVLFSVEGVLEEGDAHLSNGSFYDGHVFEGEAGQIVRILMVSEAFDTFLLLQNASGEGLTRNDDGSDGTNAEIVFRLPETGQYQIIANAYDESGKGAYRLTVERSDENRLRQAELKAQADRLLQQGLDSARLSQYQLALDSWQAALKIYRDIGNRKGEAATLGNLGIVYYSLSDYQQAIDFHQQSLAIAKEISDHQGEANSLGNLGNVYYSLGKYQRAIDFYHHQLTLAREISDRRGKSSALGNLGLVYYSLGEYQRAIDFHRQSLAIKQEIGNRQGEAISLNNLGDAWKERGQHEIAAIFYKNSINVFETIRRGITNLDQDLQSSYIASVESPYRSLIDLLLQQGRILEAQQVLELLKVKELTEFTRATYSSGQLQYDPIEQPVADAHGSLINLGAKISACDPDCDQTLYD